MTPTYNGTTIPVITVPPDWVDAVTLGTSYRTRVTEALDLSEERHQLRPRCLYSLAYRTIGLTAQASSHLRKLLQLAQQMPVGCPIWPSMVQITAAAASGATELEVESMAGRLFSVFKHVVLWRDFKTWEVVEIDPVVSPNTVPLAEATTLDWEEGDWVIPLAVGEVKRGDDTALTTDQASAEIRFEERIPYLTAEEGPWPIDPIVLVLTQDACYATVTLAWNGMVGVEYVVETADSDAGPWTAIIDPVPGDGTDTLTIGNSYSTAKSWRIRARSGTTYSDPSNVEESVVPAVLPCVISITGTTLLPDSSLPPLVHEGRVQRTFFAGGTIRNDIYPGPELIRVLQRRDYYYDPASVVSTVVSVTCPTAGATVLWTSDGELPVNGGPNTQDFPSNNGFGCVILARAYKDGCYGPTSCILVDKRVRIRNNLAIDGLGKSVIGNCENTTYTRTPHVGPGGTVTCVVASLEDSASCLINYPRGMVTHLREAVCAGLSASTNSKLYTKSESFSPGAIIPDPAGCPPGYDTWGGELDSGSASMFICTSLTWNRPSFLNSAPAGLNSYLIYQAGYDAGSIGGQRYVTVTGVTGGSGTAVSVNSALSYITSILPSCVDWYPSDILLDEVELVLTLDDDSPITD